MNRLGIIPAAGKGARFGGLYKELLPIGNGQTLLSRAVDTLEMIPVDSTLVITSHWKINVHSSALNNRNVFYAIQNDYSQDLWGAIVQSFTVDADWYYFIMPDTLTEQGRFPAEPDHEFMLGLFETDEPQNYGVLIGDKLTDKNTTISGIQLAWGTLVWSRKCVELWKSHLYEIDDFTQAFNMAMEQLGWSTYSLAWYFDCGTFERYKRMLIHV